MKVVRTAEELSLPGRRTCLAIGFFDGVHLGHQQIIRQAKGDAEQYDATSAVVTFDKHPASIVAPDHAPPLIQTMPHRLRTLEQLGPEAVLLLSFDEALRRQSGDAFIRQLHQKIGGIRSICIGADFHFGYQRSGNVALLRKLGAELDFEVHGLHAVSLDGQTISSTRIREAISNGDLETAGELLGRPHSIASRVIHGDHLGRTLGFPTANFAVTGLVLPPNGVYAAQVILNAKRHHAVANIGHRPTITLDASETRLEVHLLDFAEDLYGRELEIVLVRRLREEQHFASREELQLQICRDVAEARRLFL